MPELPDRAQFVGAIMFPPGARSSGDGGRADRRAAADVDFAGLIKPVARHLLGEPNKLLSSPIELRYGTRGSLSISLTKDAWYDHETGDGGGVAGLIQRETGLSEGECMQWLRDHGFVEREVEQPPARSNGPKPASTFKIVQTYDYIDQAGTLLFQVCRFDPKNFRQRRPDKSARDGWIWSVKGVRQVPYRLPELIEAVGNEHVVFIVEGEKDADNLWRIGLPATTNAGGAGKWRAELDEHFRGADVVVIGDNDPQKTHPKTGEPMFHPDGRPILPGQDHARDVAQRLTGIAAHVRVLPSLATVWPACPPKGDVSNWLAAGHTREQLDTLIEQLSPAGTPQSSSKTPTTTLADVLATFHKWLLLRDDSAVYVVLGTIAANLLPGDPVWVGIIAPPSSAKTELLNSLLRLPYVEPVATLTSAALLSGTPKRQKDSGAKGGLLNKIGDFGILVLKDFGSILSMHPEAKNEITAALREIYDGAWTRHFGSDGGRTAAWAGKLGLVFGATEAYDDYHSVIGQLGDRFLLYRLSPSYGGQLKKAFDHRGTTTKAMRAELAHAVAGLFAGPLREPPTFTADEFERLDKVVELAVRLRAHVTRDRYSREVENIHGAEGPGRIGLCLERLFCGFIAIGLDRQAAMRLIEDVTLHSTPPTRRRAFETLTDTPTKTRDIAKALKLPTTTTRRALEELVAQGLATRSRPKNEAGAEKDGGADLWALDPEWQDWPQWWRQAG